MRSLSERIQQRILKEAREQRLLEAAYEQTSSEVEDLTNLTAEAAEAAEVSQEQLVTRALMGGDDEIRDEIRARFEQSQSSGRFPLLSRYLANLPDEEKEEFFRAGWLRMAIPPGTLQKPWDYAPYNGNVDYYRETLYEGKAFAVFDLRMFAQEWLEELSRVGYYGAWRSGLPLKQQVSSDSAIREPLGMRGEAYPVCFEDTRQVLWLQLDGKRALERGYREVAVSDEPLHTDTAILAAVTAMEGRALELNRLRAALRALKLPLEEPMWRHWSTAVHELPDAPYHPNRFGEHLREISRQIEDSVLPGGLQHYRSLDYVLLILRYHRPDFDDLPQEEKLGLVEYTCGRINEFLEALRKLSAFIEYGVPGKRQKPAARDANRDVKAAVLRDVDRLTYRRIGEELGLPLPKDFDYKGDLPQVRQMVSRGQKILERALGKEGWQKQIEAMRAEAKRWNSLSDVEQEAENMVEHLGYPYEEALRIAEDEEARIKRRRSENQPEND